MTRFLEVIDINIKQLLTLDLAGGGGSNGVCSTGVNTPCSLCGAGGDGDLEKKSFFCILILNTCTIKVCRKKQVANCCN